MKPRLQKMRRGFTLIELSIAMTIGLMTAAMVLALFNQQLAFLKNGVKPLKKKILSYCI